MIQKILKTLQFIYYTIYITAILSAILGYYVLYSGLQIDSKSDAGITLSSILILFIIGSIPTALALFHRYTKELRAEPDMNIKLEKYKKASIIRLLVIGLGLVAGVLFFYVLHSQSMLFCAGIAAIGLVFCKLAEVKIITDLEIEETEE